jgi:hypothetical protein
MSTLKSVIIFMLVAVSFLSGGCSKRPAHGVLTSSESFVIEPGASIGPVRSDMTMQQVVAELGEPDRTNGSVLDYLNLGFSVIPGKGGVVKVVLCADHSGHGGLFTKAFAGHTKEGIGIGSSRADVVRAYGEPTTTKTVEFMPGCEILIYRPLGLDFRLQDSKVNLIGVIFNSPK